MKIIIRADGNSLKGMGHIYRCLRLAEEFEKNNHKIYFVTRNTKPVSMIVPKRIKRIIVDEEGREEILRIKPDVIISDINIHKKDNKSSFEYSLFLRKTSKLFVSLDDTSKGAYFADLCINSLCVNNLNKRAYNSIEYVIIDPQLKKYRNIYNIRKKVKNILIIQGGADTHGLTPKIIKAVNAIESHFKISVVIGPAFKYYKELNKAIKYSKKPIKVYKNIKSIGEVMIHADIAITGAGVTMLELCYLGVPSITICQEYFELETSKRVAQAGATQNLGHFKSLNDDILVQEVKKLVNKPENRLKQSKCGRKLIDGKGIKRIFSLINDLLN